MKNSNTTEACAEDTIAQLQAEISAGLEQTLENTFGPASFAPKSAPLPASAEDRVWFAYDFQPVRFGSISFGAERATAVGLGQALLKAKQRVSQHEHHALHAFGHLMNRLATATAQSLAARLNLPLECQEAASSAQPSASFPSFALEFSFGESGSSLLLCAVSPAMLEALSGRTSVPAVGAASGSASQNLDLLLDMEMPVTISLGATRLPLNEIAKLTTGSIVELNRTIAEPVDILVNNRSIAQGEVVVVEGNFAVRIKRVLSRQHRLDSLS
jgi:flagellar motor switch protein FliN/FliY